MSIYVGYISVQDPTLDDLQNISFYTPGPAIDDVSCDTQFFYGRLDELCFAIYQLRFNENTTTHDHMYFVCAEDVFASDLEEQRDYKVRAILTDFYTRFGTACYKVEMGDSRYVYKIEGLDNKALSDLMAHMARSTMSVV